MMRLMEVVVMIVVVIVMRVNDDDVLPGLRRRLLRRRAQKRRLLAVDAVIRKLARRIDGLRRRSTAMGTLDRLHSSVRGGRA